MEMNVLEREFCDAIDWRLVTTSLTLATYYTSLVRSHPNYLLNQDANPSSPHPSSTTSSIVDMDLDETDAEDLSSLTDSVAASTVDVIVPIDVEGNKNAPGERREFEEPPPQPILRPVNP
ncbi:hypothetical protein BT69DRAFT_1337692 [Atractiella rhizophila]|nr:hypothetical protein BT69DRAFT_1337692 [Atractiella rhizophila]